MLWSFVFKYFIFHCTCNVPLFSYLKKKNPGHLIILWCVNNSVESSENQIFLENVGSRALYHDYHMIMEDPQLITNERDMFYTLIALTLYVQCVGSWANTYILTLVIDHTPLDLTQCKTKTHEMYTCTCIVM